jgi:adenylate cyclase
MTYRRTAICQGCWQQMHLPIPLRGPASIPFRMFGIRPSRMNPNNCTICELMFTRVMKARTIEVDVSVMFADLRGYTAGSRAMTSGAMAGLLDAFYDECADAIWEQDGMINKTLGDAVMALFGFPVRHEDHAERAIHAALGIQERCGGPDGLLAGLSQSMGDGAIGVGIGIDAGEITFGEFGRAHKDLTAIGEVVNRASRAQAAAPAGAILATRTVRDRIGALGARAAGRDYALKGFDEPVELFAL